MNDWRIKHANQIEEVIQYLRNYPPTNEKEFELTLAMCGLTSTSLSEEDKKYILDKIEKGE